MGHASQIALGLALGRPALPVVCLDGDAAAAMHMGSLAVIGSSGAGNLRHVVLHNGAHDSVGGHPSAGAGRSFAAIALACGYPWARTVHDEQGLSAAMDEMFRQAGPMLLEVRVRRARGPIWAAPLAARRDVAALRARLSAEND